jgi:dienelactone hydrolase
MHRFIREFRRGHPRAVVLEEITYPRGDVTLPARIYSPAGARHPLPAWAVLHGLTRTGRQHRGLDRLARAFAAAGNVVFVPDIPEWRELRVAPAMTACTIRAAVRALGERPEALPGHIGLLAFSFGATQAIVAGADPELAKSLHGIVAWGGYADLHAAFRYGLTGTYEFEGRRLSMEPDPYGIWVVAANYLPLVPGHEHETALARALHDLAVEVGERGRYAWDATGVPARAVRIPCPALAVPPARRAACPRPGGPAGRRRTPRRARARPGTVPAAAARAGAAGTRSRRPVDPLPRVAPAGAPAAARAP